MKQAKRILALVIAVVMLVSFSCVTVYATPAQYEYDYIQNNANRKEDSVYKMSYTYLQGCSYLMDLLDVLLQKDGGLFVLDLYDELGSIACKNIKFIGGNDVDNFVDWGIQIDSVDHTIHSLDILFKALDTGLVGAIDFVYSLGDITSLSGNYINGNCTRSSNYSDYDIFIMLFRWLGANKSHLVDLVNGNFSFGRLQDKIADKVPMLVDLPGFLKCTLYKLLVNEDFNVDNAFSDNKYHLPAGTPTVDAMLQSIVNYALKTGTGHNPDGSDGALSVLGEDFKPLIPSIAANKINITGTSVYDMVNAAIEALLGNMVVPLLVPVVADLCDIEYDIENPDVTQQKYGEQQSAGDLEMKDTILNTVYGFATQFGADPMTDGQKAAWLQEIKEDYCVSNNLDGDRYIDSPMGEIHVYLYWLLNKGGLDAFLQINSDGITITDNFMFLLQSVARILLPGLPELLDTVCDVWSQDELNEVWYWDSEANTFVRKAEITNPDNSFETKLTYETCSAAGVTGKGFERVTINNYPYRLYNGHFVMFQSPNYDSSKPILDTEDPTVIVGYELSEDNPYSLIYCEANQGVGVLKPGSADPVDASMFDGNFVIDTDALYANLFEALMSSFIDGLYFPSQTRSIAESGAYVLAALTAKICPSYNFYEQLNANYPELCDSQGNYRSAIDGNVVEPLPFVTVEQHTYNGVTKTYEVPTACLKIGSVLGAYYLSGITKGQFNINNDPDYSFDDFVEELGVWGADTYMPILTGTQNTTTLKYANDGTFSGAFNAYRDGTSDIWDLLDHTLFTLLPNNLMPNQITSAYDFIMGWLLGNVQHLNVKGLLEILRRNTSSNAPLKNPLTTVLIRLVDRVLAIVTGGRPMLAPTNRGRAQSATYPMDNINSNPTNVTTLESLITTGLGTIVGQLLTFLADKDAVTLLLKSVLPLLLSNHIVLPTRLGNVRAVDITDLMDYVDYYDHMNTTPRQVLNGDGTVRLDENGEPVLAYDKVDWLSLSVTKSAAKDSTLDDDHGIYSYYTDEVEGRYTYSNFNYAQMSIGSGSAMNTYTNGRYVFISDEDYAGNLAAYRAYETVLKDASKFVGSYKDLVEKQLSSAYWDWQMFFIKNRLAGAQHKTIAGVDTALLEQPGIPGSMYPYSVSKTVTYTGQGPDGRPSKNLTVNGANCSPANNYVVADAIAFGENSANDVKIGSVDTNTIIRLALNLAPQEFGGVLKDLSASQMSTFTTWLSNNYPLFTIDEDEDGELVLYRPAFARFDDNTVTAEGYGIVPVTSPGDSGRKNKIFLAMYEGFIDYCNTVDLYQKNTANYYDLLSYRVETMEGNNRLAGARANADQLSIFVQLFANDYKSQGGRNTVFGGFVNGVETYKKLYTSATYSRFQDAYDLAKDMLTAVANRDAGVTQSMISKVLAELIEAHAALKESNGMADYAFLKVYVDIGNAIAANIASWGPNYAYGYTAETQAPFEAALATGRTWLASAIAGEIDDEYNSILSDAATVLAAAIQALEFLSTVHPDITNRDLEEGETEEDIVQVWERYEDEGVGGHDNSVTPLESFIYNLVEGIGLTSKESVKLVGFTENEQDGYIFDISKAAFGDGTGTNLYAKKGDQYYFYYYVVLYGDLNGDCRIDGTDKSAVELYLINPVVYSLEDYQKQAADVNHDGVINVDDYALILAYYNDPTHVDPNAKIDQNYAPSETVMQ